MSYKVRKSKAILSLRPKSSFLVTGGVVTWKDSVQVEPTESEIQAEITRLEAEYDSQDYARKRKAEYPDIYDYMDGIVKNDQTQIDKYISDSQAVKLKHPKGG
jgi:hypothetical protein